MGRSTGHQEQGWGLAEGDAITGELTAVRKLGGGAAYEAWLAFDEVTYSPVVVKLLRPDQVDDGSSRRGLRREGAALAAVNHPVVVRGLRHDLDEWDAELLSQGIAELFHRDQPATHENAAEHAALRTLRRQGGIELAGRDVAASNQDVAKPGHDGRVVQGSEFRVQEAAGSI